MRRDFGTELKELRLHGMVGAWTDLMAQGESALASSKWLIEHLLQAEHTDRAMRSVSHQMKAARFPNHRDLAGFDFASTKIDQSLVKQLATLAFVLPMSTASAPVSIADHFACQKIPDVTNLAARVRASPDRFNDARADTDTRTNA